jgi:hypothetical protein
VKTLYKVVWVDSKGKLWSALKGYRGFFRKDPNGVWRATSAVRYAKGVTVNTSPVHPYLFAFDLLMDAKNWLAFETHASSPKVWKKGHFEIWSARGEVVETKTITDPYWQMLILGPTGSRFCSSLTLVKRLETKKL